MDVESYALAKKYCDEHGGVASVIDVTINGTSILEQQIAKIIYETGLGSDSSNTATVTAIRAFVNSSINSVAAYYITSNTTGNAFATKTALDSGPWYYAGEIRTPTKNDYAIVIADETHSGQSARYTYVGEAGSGQWVFQYTFNMTFTQAQLNAINSGINSTKVALYDAHIASTANPHSVTKSQVDLGAVVNTGDSATPVSGGTTKFTTGGAYTELAKKVDKVANPTNGNFAGLNSNGNLTDSGKKASDFATAAQGVKADTAYQKAPGGIPSSDMSSAVQTSLGKADSALQSHQSLAAYRTSAAQDDIDESKTDLSVLSTPYSNTSTYAVGDYCTHDGSLYRCNTAITTAEEWTEAHWTEKKVVDGFSNVKEIKSYNRDNLVPDANGLVTLPKASNFTFGVVPIFSGYGITISANNMGLQLSDLYAPGEQIPRRNISANEGIYFNAVKWKQLDLAVKSAMTDGIGAAWTDTEKQGAWTRQAIIKTALDAVLVPLANYFLGEQSSLTLTLPTSGMSVGQTIEIVFYSGSTTAATLNVVGDFLGDEPTISTNQRVELSFLYDGTYWCLLSNVMSVPQDEVSE